MAYKTFVCLELAAKIAKNNMRIYLLPECVHRRVDRH